MKVRHLYAFLLLAMSATHALHAADPASSARGTDKAGEKPATTLPAAKLPDLAVTKFAMNTDKVDRQTTILLIRMENIGPAPSARTGVIIDCRLPDKENRHCPGSTPPPRFHLPPLAVGHGSDFKLPLRRFLSPAGNKDRHELRAGVDTGTRIPDGNRFNNFKKLEIVY